MAAIPANEASESNADHLRLMAVLGMLPLCEFLPFIHALWSNICRLAQIAAFNSGPSTRLQNAHVRATAGQLETCLGKRWPQVFDWSAAIDAGPGVQKDRPTARHSHLGRAGSTNLASFTLHLILQGA